MAEDERGGLFGFGNQWIWIVVIIVVILLIFPAIFRGDGLSGGGGGSEDGYYKEG